jgi:phosphoribosyl 1,2-cyclic phosphodiesterase
VRYGGNTSCVAIRAKAGSVAILDAGTGIRGLGLSVGTHVRRVDILLTHFHLDHIQGLGFFVPLYRRGFDVHLWGPASNVRVLRTRLTRYLSPPLFPVRLQDWACELTLHAVQPGDFELPGLDVRAAHVRHRGTTVGYRVRDGSGSIAYVPDHELDASPTRQSRRWAKSAAELVRGVDLLIHDAQYSTVEYGIHAGWGHSSIDETIRFADRSAVGRLVAFHHDPAHDDATIDCILEAALEAQEPGFDVVAAVEGSTFAVGDSPLMAAA